LLTKAFDRLTLPILVHLLSVYRPAVNEPIQPSIILEPVESMMYSRGAVSPA
jgi:hypothetical protein